MCAQSQLMKSCGTQFILQMAPSLSLQVVEDLHKNFISKRTRTVSEDWITEKQCSIQTWLSASGQNKQREETSRGLSKEEDAIWLFFYFKFLPLSCFPPCKQRHNHRRQARWTHVCWSSASHRQRNPEKPQTLIFNLLPEQRSTYVKVFFRTFGRLSSIQKWYALLSDEFCEGTYSLTPMQQISILPSSL